MFGLSAENLDKVGGWILFAGIFAGALALLLSSLSSVMLYRSSGLLKDASDERIAELEKETAEARSEIAKANERAAEANKKAEEEKLARLKLEASLAPRRLTGDQRKSIAKSLAAVEKREIAVVSKMLDGEALDFADDLASAVKDGGWSVPLREKAWAGVGNGVILGKLGVQDAPAFAPNDRTIPPQFLPGHLYVFVGPK